MLMDALDHGEDDLKARRLAENRVEAMRIVTATRKAMTQDPELLEAGDHARIDAAIDALEQATRADDPGASTTWSSSSTSRAKTSPHGA